MDLRPAHARGGAADIAKLRPEDLERIRGDMREPSRRHLVDPV